MRSWGEEELDLHSLTVDEALLKLDPYLDAVFRAGLRRVWVVHGKGTGTLRREVRRRLDSHPLVKRYRPADLSHGGQGATLVELADW